MRAKFRRLVTPELISDVIGILPPSVIHISEKYIEYNGTDDMGTNFGGRETFKELEIKLQAWLVDEYGLIVKYCFDFKDYSAYCRSHTEQDIYYYTRGKSNLKALLKMYKEVTNG